VFARWTGHQHRAVRMCDKRVGSRTEQQAAEAASTAAADYEQLRFVGQFEQSVARCVGVDPALDQDIGATGTFGAPGYGRAPPVWSLC
jgi:hypothetical protein